VRVAQGLRVGALRKNERNCKQLLSPVFRNQRSSSHGGESACSISAQIHAVL
jgi:hypothetical protein